jgi:hypothetical protein
MQPDAHLEMPRDASLWSAARRLAEAGLLGMMERARSSGDEDTRDAVRTFVEVLVRERFTPEATVIAFKDALTRAHFLLRYEPLVRAQLRDAWVSQCIDDYFAAREIRDGPSGAVQSDQGPRPLR